MSLFLLNTPVFFLSITLVVLVIALIVPIIKTKIAVISAFLLGLLYPILYYHCVYDTHLTYQQLQEKQSISGVIERVDDYKYTYRLRVKADYLASNKISPFKKVTLLLYLAKQKEKDVVINVGDKLEAVVRLKPIIPTLNHGLFDRRLYNFYHGIKYKGSITQTSQFKLTQQKQSKTHQHMRTSNYSWLYYSVLFGDTSHMPNKFKETTKQLGISHLFAVSGLHMAIVFGLSYWLARMCVSCIKRFVTNGDLTNLPYIFGIATCGLYLHLANYATSAQRAFVMLSVLCVCWLINRTYLSFRALLLAIMIVLMINPFVPLTAGFYFSFIAVLSILLCIDLVKRLKIQNKLLQLFVLQGVITVTLLPFSILFFHGVSSYSLLINLIAIPLFSICLMPLLLIISVLTVLLDTALLVTSFDLILRVIIEYIYTYHDKQIWQTMPLLSWQLALLISFSSLLMVYIPYSSYISLPIIVFYSVQLAPVKEKLEIRVLDVGHGLAVLLSKNRDAVLYDLGARYHTYSFVKSVILPTLQLNQLKLIKTVISHDDNDHSGGLVDLIEANKLQTIRGFGRACHFKEFWLEDVLFESISNRAQYRTDNNNSCVVLVTYKNFKLLLTGDIEKERELALVNDARIADIDMMVSPHHGSNSSSSQLFIEHTQPTWVIHSVNAYNRWKFPSIKVVTRYASSQVKQIATYKGAIKITVLEGHYTISTQGQTKKYWFLSE